ncbi:hypothetical protein EV174_004724 [Coemansia sp. RSA 2320]|nr:hypothetical protein EV174_004724 [Coemansia sp. RSA 2320]
MWKSYKASPTSARKELMFKFSDGQESAKQPGLIGMILRLCDTLVSWTYGSYVYNNRDKKLDKKRDPSKCLSGRKNDKLILDLERTYNSGKEITMPAKVQYNSINSSKLSTGEVIPFGNGHLVPIVYDDDALFVAVGETDYSWFVSKFDEKKKKVVMTPDINSDFVKTYNSVCDFVEEKIKSGGFSVIDPSLKGRLSKVNKLYKVTGQFNKFYSNLSNYSTFFSKGGREIDSVDDIPRAGSAIFCIRINSVFVGPKTVSINSAVIQMVPISRKYEEGEGMSKLIVDMKKLGF